jgi:leucyl-tRNA synthetase
MVAALLKYVNELMKLQESALIHNPEWREALETLVLLIAPSTPYVAEELWERLGMPYSVHHQPWPAYNEALTEDEAVEYVIQINGKVRDRLPSASNETEQRVINVARQRDKIIDALNGQEPRKIIFVQDRLVNFVL